MPQHSRFLVAILFLLATFCFGISRLASAETVEILAEDDAAPWSYQDGSGFANDVVRAAYKAVNIDIALRVMPYARCKSLTANGDATACFSMSWVPELEGKIVFSEKPLFTCYCDYFQASDRPLQFKSESEINRKLRVGIVIGYEYPPSCYLLQKQGLLELESARSDALNLKKLVRYRLDAALINHNEIKPPVWILARAGVEGKVNPTFRSGILASHIGFSVKHPQGAYAREKFDEGFRIIESNGTLKALQDQWIDRVGAETQELLSREADPRDKNALPPTARSATR